MRTSIVSEVFVSYLRYQFRQTGWTHTNNPVGSSPVEKVRMLFRPFHLFEYSFAIIYIRFHSCDMLTSPSFLFCSVPLSSHKFLLVTFQIGFAPAPASTLLVEYRTLSFSFLIP